MIKPIERMTKVASKRIKLQFAITKVATVIALLAVPVAAEADICPETRSMVEDAMPGNLEQNVQLMLQASNGSEQLADRFRAKTQILNMAFGDKLKPNNDLHSI